MIDLPLSPTDSPTSGLIVEVESGEDRTDVPDAVLGGDTPFLSPSLRPVPQLRLHLQSAQALVSQQLRDGLAARTQAFVDVRTLSKPRSLTDLRARLRTNAAAFATFYGGLTAALLVVSALTTPLLLGSWCLMGGIGAAYALAPDTALAVGRYTLGPTAKLWLVLITNLFIAIVGGVLLSVVWVLCVGASASALHAVWQRPFAPLSPELNSQPGHFGVPNALTA